ncbi:MAG: protein kinase [Vicinamibacteria bacterium]
MADPEDRDAGLTPPERTVSASSETKTEDLPNGPLPDARIGAYRILELLGAGGMGDVFLAYDERLRRRVAIKRIRSDAAVTGRARERLRREAAAAAALNHPAIVHVYDILSDESGEAIVMEYVEGETLAAARSRGPLPPAEAVRIGRQVAEGLAAAHAAGLLHRDLKTQNVMTTAAGRVKVLDFGLAKRLRPAPGDDTLTSEGSLVGTVRSMSPEQARGLDLDARSDLFSLGVLLYEICTGRPPFHGESPTETLLKLVAEPPAPIRQVSPGTPAALAALVDELLQKDPQRRPESAADVAARLAAMEETAACAVGSRSAAGRRGPGWRTLVAIAAGLLGTIAGAIFLWGRSWSPRPLAVLALSPVMPAAEGDERLGATAFAVREAIVRALADLEGVETVTADEVAADALTLQQTVRAVGADEVVVPAISCAGASCRVFLRRQGGSDVRVLGSSRPFDVSTDAEDALALTSAVALGVREIFADHRARGAGRDLQLRSEDFQSYLSIRASTARGKVPTEGDISALEELVRFSPGLFEARLLAASFARTLKLRTRALRLLHEASARQPDDPRLLYEAFLAELETGTPDDAERALGALESVVPGDVRVARGRARLLVARGKTAEALAVYQRLLRERLSWRTLWSLANLEIDLGDGPTAREHLRQLLELSPRNPRGRAKLAELEWTLGDPLQAARIYEELLREQDGWENAANLGWSRLLAREYGAAADSYRHALGLRDHDLRARLNLGIALDGAGDHAGARKEYAELLERAAERGQRGGLSASERLLEAQALARLGRTVPAVELTMKALAQGESNRQAVFQAALIYALCGDTNSAIVRASEARASGLSRAWFGLPGFESVRADPQFQALLAPGP